MNTFWRKLTWLLRRPSREAELQDELRFHLDEEAEVRQADITDLVGSFQEIRPAAVGVVMVAEDRRGLDDRPHDFQGFRRCRAFMQVSVKDAETTV